MLYYNYFSRRNSRLLLADNRKIPFRGWGNFLVLATPITTHLRGLAILESPSLGEPRTGLVACIALEEVAKPPPGVLKADDGKPEQNQRKEDIEGGSWGSGRTTPQFRTTRQLPHSVANLLGETLVQQKAGLPHHG